MLAIMKGPRILILLFGLVTITAQDAAKKKGCDCDCKKADALANPVVSLHFQNEGKPGCNICEHRKEMLRKEKEKELQFQKCPFEILGTPSMKEKTSEELFDGFRELLVPSQNGFFDMLRGVVKTMHVSSESELKWAKEKEAKLLAQKKQMEKENERRIQEEKEQKEKKEKAKEEERTKEGEIQEEREKGDEAIGREEEKPSSTKTGPFYRALFGKKESSSEPLKIDLNFIAVQLPSEDEALNLQNLESEEVSKGKPGGEVEKTVTRTPAVVSGRMTEDDLLAISSTCKKEEEEIF